MKHFIVSCLAAAALVSLSACSTVNEKKAEPTKSTTTTEQTTVPSPASTTTTTEKTTVPSPSSTTTTETHSN